MFPIKAMWTICATRANFKEFYPSNGKYLMRYDHHRYRTQVYRKGFGQIDPWAEGDVGLRSLRKAYG